MKIFLFIAIHLISLQSMICMNVTKELHSESHHDKETHNKFQEEGHTTSSFTIHDNSTSYRTCFYNEKNCYAHTYDMVAILAQTGGWILFAVVLCGILLKILTRFFNHINRNDRNVAASSLNNDIRDKQNINKHDYLTVEQYL